MVPLAAVSLGSFYFGAISSGARGGCLISFQAIFCLFLVLHVDGRRLSVKIYIGIFNEEKALMKMLANRQTAAKTTLP